MAISQTSVCEKMLWKLWSKSELVVSQTTGVNPNLGRFLLQGCVLVDSHECGCASSEMCTPWHCAPLDQAYRYARSPPAYNCIGCTQIPLSPNQGTLDHGHSGHWHLLCLSYIGNLSEKQCLQQPQVITSYDNQGKETHH